MIKKIACLTSVAFVFGLMTTVSYAQLSGLYEFDGGGDGTSWDDATNWEQKFDPFGAVISGDPATPPDGVTSADLPLPGVVIDNTMPGQTALDVNIGTAVGAGSLGISGGDLLAGRDVFVGRDGGGVNSGSLAVSGGTMDAGDDITIGAGSAGTMTISGTAAVSAVDDVFVNADSSLTVTGGTFHVGDRLTMDSNAVISVDGGDVVAEDDFFFFGSAQVTVDSGSMIVADKLRFDDVLTTGKLTVNGGLVRTQEFGFCSADPCNLANYVMNGTLEINGSGVFQSQAPVDATSPISQLTVAMAKALIADGTITTSEVAPLQLGVQTVIVPDFFGGSNLSFTQISIVPEPGSLLLLGLGGLGLLLRRKRA